MLMTNLQGQSMSISTDILDKKFKWSSPSNIALIKYWGKKENQIPQNPSLSISLSKSYTTTSLELTSKNENWINFKFEGMKKDDFIPKIEKFISRLGSEWSFLHDYSLNIESTNTFPHSSGMASSASAMSALALCFLEIKKSYNDQDFFIKASEMSRLGSGSACRSLYKGMSLWGDDGEEGSDLYGVEFSQFNSFYEGFQDTVLIISSDKKSVSSSLGHSLLDNNIYAHSRYQHARENLGKLKSILKTDDFHSFAEVVEQEAMAIHATMMTSNPSYILMKPHTLNVIEKVKSVRAKGLHLCFTLDAGPNVHLLYPRSAKEDVIGFIKENLLQFCEEEKYIEDEMGSGPVRLSEL